MAGKGKVFNVEVGDRLVKVCLSTPKGTGIQIKTSFLFQTPAGLVNDGVISDPETLGLLLHEQLQEHKLQGESKNVVFSLSSGKVATREVMLPPVKEPKLKGIVESNATEYFPVDMSKYHICHSLLERITTGDTQGCRCLVMAVPLNVLEGYFKLASASGLHITAIDYSGNSQYQALRDIADDAVTMYVNVDCSYSLVTFMQKSQFIMQRTFAFGGDEFVLDYMNATDGKDYLEALKQCSTSSPKFIQEGTMSQSAVDDSLSRIVNNIARSIDYFNSNYWETPVDRIVLMGPCSHLYGLQQHVAFTTGLTTDFLDNAAAISNLTNAASSASCFISCIGSNLHPLDMMPPQFKEEKSKRNIESKNDSMLSPVIICFVCVLAAAILSVVSIINYNNALDEKKKVEKQIEELSYTEGVYNTYLTYQSASETLTAFGATIDTPNDVLTPFMEELEKKMPSEILILSALCNRTNITMNLTVPTFEDSAVVLVKLREFESIDDLVVTTIEETTDETGGTFVAFTVQCKYKTADTSAEAVAALPAAEEGAAK